MTDKGIAHIGIGSAKGDDKALEAVKQAVASPLLETTITGASHVIINVSGDISLMDANDAASYVQEMAGEDANIIFGAMYDDTYTDECSITVIATGLDANVTGAQKVIPTKSGINFGASPRMTTPVKPVAPAAPAAPVTPAAPTFPGITTPNVQAPKEQEIKIPIFLQKNRK